ncbi:phospholipase D family protein [Verrucomicrobium sp. BvORR106]|uniref:phospholipase D family protein n=1 Tax=Verrucomicrobium sp. BvORR106 TaxID=1403819 RepID=UPI00056E3AF3|nr:phospholipase D family protein [Verrucomicrobium sp. BvORR106]
MNLTQRLPLSIAIVVCLLGSCSSPRATRKDTQPPSAASSAARDSRIVKESKKFTHKHPGQSGAQLLPRGDQSLDARLALASMASRTLDAQYYIWHGDSSGARMVKALLQAADRGVRVRVLLDDIGVSASDQNLLALAAHHNVEVRLFNPVSLRSAQMLGFLFNFSRANRRMHNKAFIADDEAVILGGRNIGNEYFDADKSVNFADLDVLAVGPVVAEVSSQFDQYWNSPYAVDIMDLSGNKQQSLTSAQRQALDARIGSSSATSPPSASPILSGFSAAKLQLRPCKAWALYDAPDKVDTAPDDKATHLAPQLWSTVEATTKHLFIVSPYFVPGEDGVAMLAGLRKRGVRVTILTNALASTDVPMVHAGYKKYRKPLLEAGVELYELKPTAGSAVAASKKRHPGGSSSASLHAKTFSFDDRKVFIGSMNLDPRSIKLNTEIGIMVESRELASSLTRPLLRNLDSTAYRLVLENGNPVWIANEQGKMVRFEKEPGTSAWQRFKVNALGLLPIEGQL